MEIRNTAYTNCVIILPWGEVKLDEYGHIKNMAELQHNGCTDDELLKRPSFVDASVYPSRERPETEVVVETEYTPPEYTLPTVEDPGTSQDDPG